VEWLLVVYLLVGVALTLRLATYIAPLQPTWMQQEVDFRWAMSFLIYSLMWPLNVGRDRYDKGSLSMPLHVDLATRALRLWNERHTITEMAILLSRPEDEVREALAMLGVVKGPVLPAATLTLVKRYTDETHQKPSQKQS
jgi:hypothetical protein